MDFSSVKFLVADDNQFARNINRTLLRAFGMRDVIEAKDGGEAIQLTKREKPDMALIDWTMPETDGLRYARWVRTSDDTPNPFLPVIILSSHSSHIHVDLALRAGVHSFICKPISAALLYAHIRRVITAPPPFIRKHGYFGPAHKHVLRELKDLSPSVHVASDVVLIDEI